jgi:hypothetical protein
MGMTVAAFGYGFVMSVLLGLMLVVTLVPFIGILWYISLFNWISTTLLTGLALQAGIVTTIMLWIGIISGGIVGIAVIIMILAVIAGAL